MMDKLNKNKIHKLLSLLQSLLISQTSDFYLKQKEIGLLISEPAVLKIASALLKVAIIQDDPYSLLWLKSKYKQYAEEHQIHFELDDLFQQGWLVSVINRWFFNAASKTDYQNVLIYDGMEIQDKEMLTFLKELSKLPYSDGILIQIPVDNKLSTELSVSDIEHSISIGLIEKIGNGWRLNPHSSSWSAWAEPAFARWWDESASKSDEEAKHWFDLFLRFNSSGRLCKYISRRKELFERCVLLLEVYIKSLEDETLDRVKIRLSRRYYLEYLKTVTPNNEKKAKIEFTDMLEELPDTLYELRKWSEIRIDALWSIDLFSSLLERLALFTADLYPEMDSNLQQRFLFCMKVPELQMYCGTILHLDRDFRLLTDALSEPMLYTEVSEGIWRGFRTLIMRQEASFKPVLEVLLEQSLDALFEIYTKKLKDWSRTKEIEESLFQLVIAMNSESRWYLETKTTRSFEVSWKVFGYFRKWYQRNVRTKSRLHTIIRDRFASRIIEADVKTKRVNVADYALNLGCIVSICDEKEDASLFARIYKQIARAITEKRFTTGLSWSFWMDPVWELPWKAIVESKDYDISSYCDEILSVNKYKNALRNNQKVLLQEGYIFLLQLYQIGRTLLDNYEERNQDQRDSLEEIFASYLCCPQDEVQDPLGPNGTDILKAKSVIPIIMVAVSRLSESRRRRVIGCITSNSLGKILLLLRNTSNLLVRRELVESVLDRVSVPLTEEIVFRSGREEAFETLLEILEEENDSKYLELSNKNNLKESDPYTKLLVKTEKEYLEYKDILSKIPNRHEAWFRMMDLRFLILKNCDREILDSKEDDETTRFYQGVTLLRRNDVESHRMAAVIFEKLAKEDKASVPVQMNYFSACCFLCAELQERDPSYQYYNDILQKLLSGFGNLNDLSYGGQKIVYSGLLLLYTSKNMDFDALILISSMPEEIILDKSCAPYIAMICKKVGEIDYLKELQRKIELRYGGNAEKAIYSIPEIYGKNHISLDKYPRLLERNSYNMEYLRIAYEQMGGLPFSDIANLRLYRSNVSNKEELMLVQMVVHAVKKMSEFCGFLIIDDRPIKEDTYSKFVQILFDEAQSIPWRISMKEQSLGGFTGHESRGRKNPGEIDLLIQHENETLSLIEAMLLYSYKKDYINEHIEKALGYNSAEVPLLFELVYLYVEQPQNLKEKYYNHLLNLRKETGALPWAIEEVRELSESDLRNYNVISYGLTIIKTIFRSRQGGDKRTMYHILTDVKKESEQVIARIARVGM